jgi:hypothetical protein
MKIFVIFIFLCLILSNYSFSQKEGNVWVFADSAAIDFNSGSPVPFLGTGLLSQQSSSSVSDSNGQLLFYAGAYTFINNGGYEGGVFNKHNELLLNGTGIFSNTNMPQSTLLLPFVYDTNKYYLFSNRGNGAFDLKIYYSVIDNTANQDSGDVILKNIQLPGIANMMTGYLYATRHGNGKDWWLITHKAISTEFYKYLIDSSGINGPFIQSIGNYFDNFDWGGQLKISSNGEKIIVTSHRGIIDLYDFNRCTGILSNFIALGYTNTNPFHIAYYGCSFSPDSRFLYVSGEDSLFQFDLQSTNISSSKQLIWYDNDTMGDIGQHMLGPDGKIYIAYAKPTNWINNVFTFENMNLSVINSPDSFGAACNFQPFSFNLGGRRSFYGLPNIPDYKLGEVEGGCVVSVEEVEGKNILEVYPNPAQDILYLKGLDPGEKYQLLIYDVTGRIILTEKITTASVDIHQLTLGLYFYKIENNKSAIKSGRITIIK